MDDRAQIQKVLEEARAFHAGIIHGLKMAVGANNPLAINALLADAEEKLRKLKAARVPDDVSER